uniref:Uncharacterized protein n=1 Tax=Arundo donax TaxID=35708 RepID=A0A0A9BGM6_ARUDO
MYCKCLKFLKKAFQQTKKKGSLLIDVCNKNEIYNILI